MNWPQIPLHHLLQINTSVITLSEHLFYKQATLQAYPTGVVLKGVKSGLGFPKKQQKLVRVGQFIISQLNIVERNWGIIPEELDGAIVTQGYLNFDIHPDLHPDYFGVYLATVLFRKAAFAACSERGRLEIREFMKITLPLPPPENQQQIASLWKHAHSILEHTAEMAASIEDIKSGVMINLFQNGNASWEKTRLGNCAIVGYDPAENYTLSLLPPDQIVASAALLDKGGIGIKPSNEVDAPFLYFYLQYRRQALGLAFKEANPGIEDDILRAFPVLLPTLYEQQKISGLLQQHDRVLLQLRMEQSALQKLIDGLIHSIFTNTLNLQEVIPVLQRLRSIPILQ
ncbi:MAG TPA: restriction endonuclease subunit S [Phototrophicaceae bacterium]|jgi:restriction endonuclease S subunit|nr:restriction endonuclease subunit S [Phototrophicaceae bacterium]